MNAAQATRFAALALACIEREFPCQPGHVLREAGDLHLPRALHPAFFGCYDWHSAVHGHWLLAHLLRRFPDGGHASTIRATFERTLTAENLGIEARYLQQHPGFERPYGWAWLLKLACELSQLGDPQAKRWSASLLPLAEAIETLYMGWLPRQTYPIRAGVHANTAFGLAFALDYARAFNRRVLCELLVEKSRVYFESDRDYPAQWEPGGNDFFSPCLIEADLMRRVLPDFPAWLASFLPKIPPSLLEPATVSDRSDGQLVHLDGLNLSRAWCFSNLQMRDLAEKHLAAGLRGIESGHYEGRHWLATFAAYALACAFEGATTTPASRNSATWRE